MNDKNGPAPTHTDRRKKTNFVRSWVVLAVAALILVVGVGAGIFALRNTSANSHIESGQYQAVFFTNGQVYFGKLSPLSGGYMKLENIYYLQTKATSADASNPQETATDSSNDVELVKLGNEIHGPEDEMILSKDQILFFENLKKDSRVSQAIESNQGK